MSETLKKTSNFIDWISEPKRAIAIAVLLLILGVAVWFISKKAKTWFTNIKTKLDYEATVSEKQLSYPKEQYNSYAEQIYNAWGTFSNDLDTVYSVLRNMQSNADFLALKNAFGTRALGLLGTSFFSTHYDLEAYIRKMSNPSQLSQCNRILENNGITYRF